MLYLALQAKACLGDDAAIPKVLKTKAKRRPGSGGAWRSWVRLHSKGAKGLAKSKELAGSYAVAKLRQTPEFLQAQQLGTAATGAARIGRGLGKRRRSSFCPAVVHKSSHKQMLDNLWNDIQGLSFVEQGLAIINKIVIKPDLSNLNDAASMAKACQRQISQRKFQQEQDDIASLEAFSEKIGQKQVQSVCDRWPFLSKTMVKPMPAGEALCFQYQPPTVESAVHATAWASDHRNSNVGVSLSHFWEVVHETVVAKNEASSSHSTSLCFQYGKCICQSRTRKTMNLAFLQALKAFMKNPKVKNLNQEASVIIHLFTDKVGHDSHGASSSSSASTQVINLLPLVSTVFEAFQANIASVEPSGG